MPRIQWTEKAKRLAKECELYDADDGCSQIEINLTRKDIAEFGILTGDGRHIIWFLKDGVIDCEVRLR